MGSKKKLLTTVAALTTAAALLLGGTFAWQSISQSALNESADTINPGGRLHNDIAAVEGDPNSTYNFIYVENFSGEKQDDGTVTGGEDIYARIRLEEYMELVMNYGDAEIEVVKNVAGVKTLLNADAKDENGNQLTNNSATRQDKFKYTYELHLFGEAGENEEPLNATDKYWTWTTGTADYAGDYGYYMPTYNKNKDSLAADQNGSYTVTLGGITDRDKNYADFVDYSKEENKTKSAYAIYDKDGNDTDELAVAGLSATDLNDIIENGDSSTKWTANSATFEKAVHLENESHTAKEIPPTKGLISMEKWLGDYYDLNGGNPDYLEDHFDELFGNRWVYDSDGWVYWSSPIHPGQATGPLLEGFSLRDEMDDTWYYAINVVAQFITADDLGKTDNTGFYDESGWYDPTDLGEDKAAKFEKKGKAPSENALSLLTIIGVNTEGYNPQSYTLTLNGNNNFVYAKVGDVITLTDVTADDLTVSLLMGDNTTQKLKAGINYRYDNGKLTLLETAPSLPSSVPVLCVKSGDSTGYILVEGEYTEPDDRVFLHLTNDSEVAMYYASTSVGSRVEILEFKDGSSTAPEDLTVTVPGDDTAMPEYTYSRTGDKGVLVISDPDYAGKLLLVADKNDSGYRGVLAVAPLGELNVSGAGTAINEVCLNGSKYYFSATLDGKTLSGEEDAANLSATYQVGEETKTPTVTWEAEDELFCVDVGDDLSRFKNTVSTTGTTTTRTRTVPVTLLYAEEGETVAIGKHNAKFTEDAVQLMSDSDLAGSNGNRYNTAAVSAKSSNHRNYIELNSESTSMSELLQANAENFEVNTLFQVWSTSSVSQLKDKPTSTEKCIELTKNDGNSTDKLLCYEGGDSNVSFQLWVDLEKNEAWLVFTKGNGSSSVAFYVNDGDNYYARRIKPTKT